MIRFYTSENTKRIPQEKLNTYAQSLEDCTFESVRDGIEGEWGIPYVFGMLLARQKTIPLLRSGDLDRFERIREFLENFKEEKHSTLTARIAAVLKNVSKFITTDEDVVDFFNGAMDEFVYTHRDLLSYIY